MSKSYPDQPANPKAMRKQLFVDPKVQGTLVARVVAYWVVCLITMASMLLCWRILTDPIRPVHAHFEDMWFFYGPTAIASFLLLPLVIVDIIRLSNRFTGPLLRLRRSMRALARGERVTPIEFRDGDFWQDFADEFNQILARVQATDSTPDGEPMAEDELEEPITAAAV